MYSCNELLLVLVRSDLVLQIMHLLPDLLTQAWPFGFHELFWILACRTLTVTSPNAGVRNREKDAIMNDCVLAIKSSVGTYLVLMLDDLKSF